VVNEHGDYQPKKRFLLLPSMLRVARSMELGDLSPLPLMVYILPDIPPSPSFRPFSLVNTRTCSIPIIVDLNDSHLRRLLQSPLAPLVNPHSTSLDPNLCELLLANILLTTSSINTSNGPRLYQKRKWKATTKEEAPQATQN